MKRMKLTSIAVVSLVALSLTSAVLSGCSNTKTQAATNSTQSEAAGNNASKPQNKFLTAIKDSLAALVKDGTITQEQSDKILEALTPNRSANSQKKSSGGYSNNGQPSGYKGKSGSSGRHIGIDNKALAQLVTDKVITQAQADAVINKINSTMPAPQTNGNSNNSSNSGNNSSSSETSSSATKSE